MSLLIIIVLRWHDLTTAVKAYEKGIAIRRLGAINVEGILQAKSARVAKDIVVKSRDSRVLTLLDQAGL